MKERKTYTHHDLAKMVGVSQSTVSRALDPEQRHLISEEVATAVLKAAEAVGFRSNVLARRLRNRRAETITLVIPTNVFEEPSNLDFEGANSMLMWGEVQGVMHEAMARGYEVKLVPQYTRDPALREHFSAHVGYPHSDGVIFGGLGTVDQQAGDLLARGIPCIATGARREALPIPLVAIDQAPGIEQAIAHLISDGHRRIAFLAYAPDFTTGSCWLPRHAAVTGALTRAGILDPALFVRTADEEHLRSWLEGWGPQAPCSAIFCTNDILASRLIRELSRLGRRVPQDLAVIGFDNHPLYRHGEHALSTVDLPLYEMGRRAVARLIDMIESGQRQTAVELIPSTFVARKTG